MCSQSVGSIPIGSTNINLSLTSNRYYGKIILYINAWVFQVNNTERNLKMARKGKRRSITVFGCTLDDGSTINNTDEGITSVIVNPDKTVTITDAHHNKTIVEGAVWVSYVPRAN